MKKEKKNKKEESTTSKFRSGFVAIVGRPNVGKSTLLNALMGQKIAIVTEKPQTTRTKITGILTGPDYQIVFIDTPGIHLPRDLLDRTMVEKARSSLTEADYAIFIVDAREAPHKLDLMVLEDIKTTNVPTILAINKIDLIPKEQILKLIEEFQKLHNFAEYFPISATKMINILELKELLISKMPEGPCYFPDGEITEQTEREIISEFIREQVFLQTRQEVPYSTVVHIEEYEFREDKDILYIDAAIIVEKDSQKGIIIGKQGKMLKSIGSEARKEIETFTGKKVFLQLTVKVKEKWRDNRRFLKEIGYL